MILGRGLIFPNGGIIIEIPSLKLLCINMTINGGVHLLMGGKYYDGRSGVWWILFDNLELLVCF